MKIPIIHVPRIADQEAVIRALYVAGYQLIKKDNVDSAWAYWCACYMKGTMSHVPYIYIDGGICGTDFSPATWDLMGQAHGPYAGWVRVNSAAQMGRYLINHALAP
jgi:hypothetical protein